MNALSLYVTTCRSVFQADINNGSQWSDINRLIIYLRQSLTCCVCGQLLAIPMTSAAASCQHHVCKACIGGKMRLKPSCSWCKDYSKFIENVQLRILLQCYKRLSLYIKKFEISKKWANLQTNTPVLIGSSANSIYNQNVCPTNFKDLIDEASNLQDNFTFFERQTVRNLNKSTNNSNQTNLTLNNQANSSINNLDNQKSMQSSTISLATNKNIVNKQQNDLIKNSNSQATIVRLTTIDNQLVNNTTSHLTSNNVQVSTNSVTPVKTKQHKVRKGCRCGMATPNPGKLTCCGQRCPCYVEGKACFECKCRGCRNNNNKNLNNNNQQNNDLQIKNSNLISTKRASPLFITNLSTNNLTTNSNLISTSPLFTTSNLQLNSNSNQTALLSSPPANRNLLSPSLLSSSINNAINNQSSATLINNIFPSGTKINIISSTSSSPICVLANHANVGNVSAVGVDSLNLPFPTIENIEDQVIELPENSIQACIEDTSQLLG